MINTAGVFAAPIQTRGSGWVVLTLVLYAPAAAAVIRKFWAGQPVFIEALPMLAILIAFLWALPRARNFPSYIALPMAIWLGIQAIYTIPALMEHPVLGVASFMVRTVPLMMPVIAFAAIRSIHDFQSVALTFGMIALFALPVGLIAGLWGEDGLPYWLRSIESFSFGGSALRAGLPALSFIFSTPAVLATTVGANAFLALAAIRSQELPDTWRRTLWIIAIGSLLLLFLSTWRGMFAEGLSGGHVTGSGNSSSQFCNRTVPTILVPAPLFLLQTQSCQDEP